MPIGRELYRRPPVSEFNHRLRMIQDDLRSGSETPVAALDRLIAEFIWLTEEETTKAHYSQTGPTGKEGMMG